MTEPKWSERHVLSNPHSTPTKHDSSITQVLPTWATNKSSLVRYYDNQDLMVRKLSVREILQFQGFSQNHFDEMDSFWAMTKVLQYRALAEMVPKPIVWNIVDSLYLEFPPPTPNLIVHYNPTFGDTMAALQDVTDDRFKLQWIITPLHEPPPFQTSKSDFHKQKYTAKKVEKSLSRKFYNKIHLLVCSIPRDEEEDAVALKHALGNLANDINASLVTSFVLFVDPRQVVGRLERRQELERAQQEALREGIDNLQQSLAEVHDGYKYVFHDVVRTAKEFGLPQSDKEVRCIIGRRVHESKAESEEARLKASIAQIVDSGSPQAIVGPLLDKSLQGVKWPFPHKHTTEYCPTKAAGMLVPPLVSRFLVQWIYNQLKPTDWTENPNAVHLYPWYGSLALGARSSFAKHVLAIKGDLNDGILDVLKENFPGATWTNESLNHKIRLGGIGIVTSYVHNQVAFEDNVRVIQEALPSTFLLVLDMDLDPKVPSGWKPSTRFRLGDEYGDGDYFFIECSFDGFKYWKGRVEESDDVADPYSVIPKLMIGFHGKRLNKSPTLQDMDASLNALSLAETRGRPFSQYLVNRDVWDYSANRVEVPSSMFNNRTIDFHALIHGLMLPIDLPQRIPRRSNTVPPSSLQSRQSSPTSDKPALDDATSLQAESSATDVERMRVRLLSALRNDTPGSRLDLLTLAVARSPQMQMSYAEFKDHAARLGYPNPEWTLANHGRQGDKILEKVPPFIRIRPSLQEAAQTVLSTATDVFRVN
jgi:hypothetical protein